MNLGRSAWTRGLYFLPLALLATFYGGTYFRCLILWYDDATDDSIVVYRGKMIIMHRIVPFDEAPMSTVQEARMIARGRATIFPQPKAFFRVGGRRIVPLFPFVAVSMLPPLAVLRPYQRRRWWKELVPAIPFLLLVIFLNGDWIRQVGEHGLGNTVANFGSVIEVIGFFGFAVVAGAWVVWLPLSIRNYRKARFEDQPQCLKCGYDLTGNTSGVCPECGGAA